MQRSHVDEGLILKKTALGERDILLTILSKSFGKIKVRAFGVKKITSRRISHLETGNYIKFSITKNAERFSLGETELMWGYSNIKSSKLKMDFLYLLFLILNRIIPEEHNEELAFNITLDYLKKLNNNETANHTDFETALKSLLLSLGYIDDKTASLPLFNPISFIEELIGRKINLSILK